MSKDKRIDLTQWKNEHREVYACCEAGEHYTDILLAELKRCYEEIDNLLKEKNRLIDIAERCGAWEGNFDFSDINDEYGACNICGSIPSGCCEASE